jgi:hypothetical protein
VASFPLHADGSDSLFVKADEALYVAKQQGRNCVRVATRMDSAAVAPVTPPAPPALGGESMQENAGNTATTKPS